MLYFIGIDIGSTSAKTVVMNQQKQIILRLVQPTGWSSGDTAMSIREQLLAHSISPEQAAVVATGYGRISVPYAHKCVTEITCHGKGACYIHDCRDLSVIDIGGQDTKNICVQDGCVKDFIMNDKCSAGTGRFLEVMANTLALSPDQLCALAEKGGSASISSMCTVFAESEVISLIGQGESRENIAFAVVDSIVKKVAVQAGRMIGGGAVCLTGGLCQCEYIRKALAKALGAPVMTDKDGRYAGAIGAALSAYSVERN